MDGTHATKLVTSIPGEERVAMAPFGGKIVIHATSVETNGTLGIWETYTPPGQGPVAHTHTLETEIFRVIRGTYHFRCGDREFDAPPGSVIVLPPLIEHEWRNISDEMGLTMAVVTPGGCERMFIDIAESKENTREAMASIIARYGIENADTHALGLNQRER